MKNQIIYLAELPSFKTGNIISEGESKAFTSLKAACDFTGLSYSTLSKHMSIFDRFSQVGKKEDYWSLTSIKRIELMKIKGREGNSKHSKSEFRF